VEWILELTTQPKPVAEKPDAELSHNWPEHPKQIRVLAFMEAQWLTGPARNLIRFARHASDQGENSVRAKLDVATFQRGNDQTPNAFMNACKAADLRVFTIRERFLFDPSAIAAMTRLIISEDPDIVQTHGVKSHFLMWLTRAYRSRRWIAFHHGYTWTDLKMRVYNQFDRISLPAAHQIVTVCQPFADAIQEIGIPPERIVVRHNSVTPFVPVSHDRMLRLKEKFAIQDGVIVILTVGRLSREKGHNDLIRALSQIREEKAKCQIRLIIVGDGPERVRIQETAKECAVNDWVTLAGHQADVAPFYSLADIVVLPSHTEGSPNTLLEAMAAGIPVIATAVGGVPEIVKSDESALLIEKQNPHALAQAIMWLVESEDRRNKLGMAGRSVASGYSPERYCDAMLSLYNRLVPGVASVSAYSGE